LVDFFFENNPPFFVWRVNQRAQRTNSHEYCW